MPPAEPGTEHLPTREEAIDAILRYAVAPEDAVVSTTGYASREVYEIRERLGQSHDSDFLTVGSMGHSLAIAHGIALAQPNRTVWCLDGDGSTLMHMGNLALSGAAGLGNLRHVVLNNGVHDSVGAQPTAVSMGRLDLTAAAAAAGYLTAPPVESLDDMEAVCSKHLAGVHSGVDGVPRFLEVKLRLGVRDGLGRPKTSTQDAKKAFMRHLRPAHK